MHIIAYEMNIAKKPIHKSNAFINTLMGTLLILAIAYSDTPINSHRPGLPNQQQRNILPNSLNNPINAAQQKRNQRARILSSQQQKKKDKPKQADSGNNENKTFFLTIVIIVIVFFVLGVLCCLACIIRYICIKQRSHSTSAVANSKINHELIFPAISYPLFLAYVGQPFQAHCVICLQEFAQTKNEDEVKESEPTLQQKLQIQKTLQLSGNLILAKNTIRQQKSDSVQRKPLSQPEIKSLQYIQSLKQTEVEKKKVKFTVCGHLLHSKCLDDWLLRLETCLLCRQQFSFENITTWQKKLDVNFSNEFDYFFNGKISKGSNKQINRQQTLAQIQRSLSKNDIQFMEGTQEHNKKRVNLRKHEKYALDVYLKIMSYHRRNIEGKDMISLLQNEGPAQLYFNELENQQLQNQTNERNDKQCRGEDNSPSIAANQSVLSANSRHRYPRTKRYISNY